MIQGKTIPPPQGAGPGGCTGRVLRGVQRSAPAEETAASEEVSTISGTPVEKQPDDSIHLRDNDGLYTVYDDSGVVTMYLTVTRGNEAENTDHTWAEINSYSVYDYEHMQVPRYQTAALLQGGDENGPLLSEVGYGGDGAERDGPDPRSDVQPERPEKL